MKTPTEALYPWGYFTLWTLVIVSMMLGVYAGKKGKPHTEQLVAPTDRCVIYQWNYHRSIVCTRTDGTTYSPDFGVQSQRSQRLEYGQRCIN